MYKHYSVMLTETIDGLNIKEDGIYLDMTMGGAGHSKAILSKLTTGKLIAFDQDLVAIENARKELTNKDNFIIIQDNFVNFYKHLKNLNITEVDGVLYDLGVSSMQLDQPIRGFSYIHDGELDMRMNNQGILTAKDIVNGYSVVELQTIFRKYGEEKHTKRIVEKIVESREIKEITTTSELNEVIFEGIGKKNFYKAKSHPSKRIFQALRIEVNDELKVFENSLIDATKVLKKNGRIVVLTFHSLEDKICKYYFDEITSVKKELMNLPVIPEEYLPHFRKITKKPITANEIELEENSRSKSAKLRILEKL